MTTRQQRAVKQANYDHSELESERFCELVDAFGCDPDTRAKLMAILEAKAAPDDQHVQFQSLANRLADLIDDPHVPRAAANLLEQAATDFINNHAGDDRSYVRRRFAVACALATAQEGAGKSPARS